MRVVLAQQAPALMRCVHYLLLSIATSPRALGEKVVTNIAFAGVWPEHNVTTV